MLGVSQDFDSRKEWEEIETKIAKEIYGEDGFYKLLKEPKKLNKIYEDCNRQIVIKLEDFFRAIIRQFIFGNFSSDSKTFVFQVDDFANITDEQLGQTDYRNYRINERIKR